MDGLPCKLLVRVHGYYHSPYSLKRKEFEKFNEEFDIIRKNLAAGIFPEEMVNDKHPEAISGPVDVYNMYLSIENYILRFLCY